MSEKLDELTRVMDMNRDFKNIDYFKAYIRFYQVYYETNLDEAKRNAAGDLMHSDEFDDCIETLIEAYFELKKENEN